MVLRIAFDIAAVWRGGAERETLEVASRLSDLGHDVLLIVNKRAEYFAEYVDRVQIVELGRTNRWDVRVLPDIRRALKAFNADVCVCVMFNASLWGRLAAASLGCRVVVAEHSTTGKTRLAERLANILLGSVTETRDRVRRRPSRRPGTWRPPEAQDTRGPQRRGHQSGSLETRRGEEDAC